MKNEVMMKFPVSIYDVAVLQQAAEDYAGICDVDVMGSKQSIEDKEYIICKFAHSKADMELTVKEFCNYVIAHMNVRRV